jgi:hypothetical protein
VPIVLKSGSLKLLEPSGPVQGLLHIYLYLLLTSDMNSAANGDSNTVRAAYYHFVCRGEESCDAVHTSVLLAYMNVFRIIIIIIIIVVVIVIIISSSSSLLCVYHYSLSSPCRLPNKIALSFLRQSARLYTCDTSTPWNCPSVSVLVKTQQI